MSYVETQLRFMRAVNRLPKNLRYAFLAYNGLLGTPSKDHEEVAEALGVTPRTAQKYYKEALTLIADNLLDEQQKIKEGQIALLNAIFYGPDADTHSDTATKDRSD